MKIAFVYDRVNKFGGAEQVLLALHSIWPQAPLYTAVYDAKAARWANVFRVHPSFLNRLPYFRAHHELLPLVTPVAFESFSFDDYEVVISITSSDAKSIITKPDTIHICYCLTPTRYLWSGFDTYIGNVSSSWFTQLTTVGLKLLKDVLRGWDLISSSRPDYYIAISSLVKTRINFYYKRTVDEVIHPPINTDIYTPAKDKVRPSFLPPQYFLVVSRFVKYKRIDLIIDACNDLKLPLVIIGGGREAHSLRRRAGKTVQFVSNKLTTEELAKYYQYCEAFVFAAEEDFGIVAGEAQSSGKPVIAFKKSGIADIVVDGKTGILYDEQSKESLIDALLKFNNIKFDSMKCRQRALQFSQSVFEEKIRHFVQAAKRI